MKSYHILYIFFCPIWSEIAHAQDPKPKSGEVKEWLTHGQTTITHYRKGKKDGVYTRYYSNGYVCIKCVYKKDILHGWYEEYYKNGKPIKTGKYAHGLKTGTWKYCRRNGIISRIENYRNGIKDGLWITSFKDSIIEKEQVYVNGRLKKQTEYFHEIGNRISKIAFYNILNGSTEPDSIVDFYNSGQIKSATSLSGSTLYISWNEKGQKTAEQTINKHTGIQQNVKWNGKTGFYKDIKIYEGTTFPGDSFVETTWSDNGIMNHKTIQKHGIKVFEQVFTENGKKYYESVRDIKTGNGYGRKWENQLMQEGTYEHNKLVRDRRWRNDVLVEESHFHDRMPDSIANKWYPSGALESQITYNDSGKAIKELGWSLNGTKILETNYLPKKVTTWYDDGTKKFESVSSSKRNIGTTDKELIVYDEISNSWYPNGNKKVDAIYVSGAIVKWKEWTESGILISDLKYENGYSREAYFWPNGKRKSLMEYKNGNRIYHGWDEKGKPESEPIPTLAPMDHEIVIDGFEENCSPSGGIEALKKKIIKQIMELPDFDELVRESEEYNVLLGNSISFELTIDNIGRVTNVKNKNQTDSPLEERLVKILKVSGWWWNPKKINGKAIESKYLLVMDFQFDL